MILVLRSKILLKKLLLILCLLTISIFATNSYSSNVTYLMDTPTYSILDYGSYDLQFRIFSNGGVLTKLNFGIFKPLNIGVSWELASLIGVDDVTVAIPALQVKLNLYSGSEKLPGVAVGYDGQGFFYDPDKTDFIQKGKGVYVVAGKEILFPSLNLNIGLNMNEFKEPRIIGFAGASYILIEETLMFMMEYDNIGKGAYTRANAGLRLWITENFDIDFMLRNFTTTDKDKFGCERIFKVSYQSKF